MTAAHVHALGPKNELTTNVSEYEVHAPWSVGNFSDNTVTRDCWLRQMLAHWKAYKILNVAVVTRSLHSPFSSQAEESSTR